MLIYILRITCISWRTYAGESRAFVDASSTVFASAGLTSIVFVLTTDSRIIVGAGTIQTRTKILTTTMMHARISDATFWCCFTLLAIGTGWAAVD